MRRVLAVALTCLATAGVGSAQGVHHRLRVRLDPDTHRLAVVDAVRLPEAPRPGEAPVRFLLHAGLAPEVISAGWRLEKVDGPVDATFFGINATTDHLAQRAPLEAFTLTPSPGAGREVELRYSGVVNHPVAISGEEYQRSFSETAGIVDHQGVFLAGTSFWVPLLGPELVTFDLEVTGLPAGWDAVSQGARVAHERSAGGTAAAWSCTTPAEEVYLVAGPWTEYTGSAGKVALYVFLRTPDEALARRYLEATVRYLTLYEKLLTPFPYPSFALVENFWETGYGMPGFTLLGSSVIRFPWILTSSYPHELLHTWWGNSVYVDPSGGNWCEGLTAYLADHMFAEQRGEGEAYRRDTLKKYSDFARGGKDIALDSFRSRTSAASEAVGYGKGAMLLHMVRRELGDESFLAALRAFFASRVYTRATFSDLAAAFEAAAGRKLAPLSAGWTGRTGAPLLRVAGATVEPGVPSGFVTTVTLTQDQPEAPFPLSVPLELVCSGSEKPVTGSASFVGRTASALLRCDGRPLRLEVDSHYDVMRRLDPREVAPTLSTLFGDDAPSYVLPTLASEAERTAWRELAAGWQQGKAEPRFVSDVAKKLPAGNLWALGWDNTMGPLVLATLASQGAAPSAEGVAVNDTGVARAGGSLVLVARRSGSSEQAVAWVAADPQAAIPGLGRKLPHYGKYGYLGFRGEAPDNTLKGAFEAADSPTVRVLDPGGEKAGGRRTPRAPLAELPPQLDSSRLAATVTWLAEEARQGRGLGSPGLDAATTWVESALKAAGLEPAGEGSFRQSFPWRGGTPERDITVTNLLGRIPGSDLTLASFPVLVVAHLDHLGRGWPDVRAGNAGQIHPGADDNVSGVAALIELARHFAAGPRPLRPILFAVTSGEEAGRVGSRHLIEAMGPTARPMACLCLDTIGRLKDGKLYALDTPSARELPFILMGAGATVGVPVLTPAEKLDSSDQASCLELGVPGVQLFAGPSPDYHRPGDTADKIDLAGLVKVAEVSREVVAYLAGRAEPLHTSVTGSPAVTAAATAPPAEGRASLGTMPDFAFSGPGVKVAQVMPGSAAEAAGIVAGDVVLTLGEKRLDGLKDLSEALKSHRPGEQVHVTVVRAGKELELPVTLKAR